MKTIPEIQNELRKLSNQIESLSNELEELKQKEQPGQEETYQLLQTLAMQHPIKNKALAPCSEAVKKLYLQVLAIIAVQEEVQQEDRLLFIERIAQGIGCSMPITELLKSGMTPVTALFEDMIQNLSEYKKTLLLDCYIVSNLTGCISEKELKLMVEIAALLGCSKEEILIISKIAGLIIMDDLMGIGSLNLNMHQWNPIIQHYISKELVVSSRIECYEYKKPEKSNFLWYTASMASKIKYRIECGAAVKEGDKILEYEELPSKVRTITAPKDGLAYFAEVKKKSASTFAIEGVENYIKVYVVSYFDDYEDFCNWVATKENQ